MRSAADRIPVIVLSGFLGSGKTTLLNALLRDPAFSDTAVIVNELGEIGLDNLLVEAIEDNVVLLSSGCLCCSLMNSLRETLLDLHARRLSGAAPPFVRVIVETTGLADPAPILQSLLRDPMITPMYAFDELVTVVDALFADRELDRHAEARQQVALADRLVLSKLDVAAETGARSLRARLRGLNPAAPIIGGRGVASTSADIFKEGAPGRRAGRSAVDVERVEAQGDHDHAHHDRHDPLVRADSFIIEGPVDWAGLAAWQDVVREFFGGKMLRAKGLLEVRGASGPVLIQGVQTVFAQAETLAAWPDADHRSRLVCITQDLEPELLRASLKTLHAEAGTYRPATVEAMLAQAGA